MMCRMSKVLKRVGGAAMRISNHLHPVLGAIEVVNSVGELASWFVHGLCDGLDEVVVSSNLLMNLWFCRTCS
jgi:hypothetical protein